MQIVNFEVALLIPYENTPRKNDHVIPRMIEIIREFGFKVPILVRSNGEIIDGHMRYKAALSMGLEQIPALICDDLGEEQICALRIMLNRSATWADWDNNKLLIEINKLVSTGFNITLTGFEQRELDAMLISLQNESSKDADKIPDAPQTPLVSDGEIWLLGRHRMMCGDSTSHADMHRLMRGHADMIWTDPPYNVNYEGKAGKIKNDKMNASSFDAFLLAAHQVMFESVRPGGAIYVAHAEAGDGMTFRRAFIAAGFKLSACLIWHKQTATLGRGDYHFQHEPILYGWKKGDAHKWYGDRKQKSVFELGFDTIIPQGDNSFQLLLGNKLYRLSGEIVVEELSSSIISIPKPVKSDLHPTTKPVALIERMVSNSCPKNGSVLDPFGGSGSTLMACEVLGRNCRTMEKDTKYAQVIIRRWEDYTGLVAIRETDGKALNNLGELV